jgi:PAS domain S-box-containing protein
MEIVTVWWPFYPLSAVVKVVCAAASLLTAILLARVAPALVTNAERFILTIEREQNEKTNVALQLRKVEEKLGLALQASNGVGTWDWDVPYDLLKADATVAEFFGVDPVKAAHGLPVAEFTINLHPDDVPLVVAALNDSIKNKTPYSIEYRLLHPDGSLRWLAARGRCSFSSDNTPLQFTGVVIDISESKRTEAALLITEQEKHLVKEALYAHEKQAGEERMAAADSLREADRRFRLMVEGVIDHALFTIDLQGIVTSWNFGAERLLGYTSAEMIGRSFACFFTAEDLADRVPERQMSKALQATRAEDEGWRIRSDGRRFWATISKTALFESSGAANSFAVIIQDTTERKKIAVTLEETMRERSRLQERFLSHVSHELRTPLTAIYFFTSNVADGLLGEISPGQKEQLLLALENVSQLKEMVSDLLDITRVESHKLTVNPKQASMERLIGDVMRACQTTVADKISFQIDLQPDLPFVWVDPFRVRQILTNLLDNAIKFSPRDSKITVQARHCSGDDGFLCISVIDHGCGIDQKDCVRVFDRLAQVESKQDSSRSGLGLGLFITKELVVQHGGRIWVESQIGQGSTFSFTLPIFSIARRCAHILTASNLDRGRVTLITLNVIAGDTDQPEQLSEIARLVEFCTQPSQDVVLPWMSSHDQIKTLFVVACTDRDGYTVIAQRIGIELKKLDYIVGLHPSVSSITFQISPGMHPPEQVKEVVQSLEKQIQQQLQAKELFQ